MPSMRDARDVGRSETSDNGRKGRRIIQQPAFLIIDSGQGDIESQQGAYLGDSHPHAHSLCSSRRGVETKDAPLDPAGKPIRRGAKRAQVVGFFFAGGFRTLVDLVPFQTLYPLDAHVQARLEQRQMVGKSGRVEQSYTRWPVPREKTRERVCVVRLGQKVGRAGVSPLRLGAPDSEPGFAVGH